MITGRSGAAYCFQALSSGARRRVFRIPGSHHTPGLLRWREEGLTPSKRLQLLYRFCGICQGKIPRFAVFLLPVKSGQKEDKKRKAEKPSSAHRQSRCAAIESQQAVFRWMHQFAVKWHFRAKKPGNAILQQIDSGSNMLLLLGDAHVAACGLQSKGPRPLRCIPGVCRQSEEG